MTRRVETVKCPECGEIADRVTFEADGTQYEYYDCHNPLCIFTPDNVQNGMARLEARLKEDDFAIGDSFWVGNWEFMVVSTR